MNIFLTACCVAAAAAQMKIDDLRAHEANQASCMQRAKVNNPNEAATFDMSCVNNGGLGCVKSNMPGTAFNGCRFCEFGEYSSIPCNGQSWIQPVNMAQSINIAQPILATQPVLQSVTTVQPVTTQVPVTKLQPVTKMETVQVQQPVTSYRTVTKQEPVIKYQPVQSFKTVAFQQPVTEYRTVAHQKPVVKYEPVTTFQPRTSYKTVTSYQARPGSYSYQPSQAMYSGLRAPQVSYGRSALYSQRPNFQRSNFAYPRRYGQFN